MKTNIVSAIIITFILIVGATHSILAQQPEYRWGKWSEGQAPSGGGGKVDRIVDSYIDSSGNTYILGKCGKDARLGANGPYICPMDSIPGYLVYNSDGFFLAKIDSVGNIVWCKSVRGGTTNSGGEPWNMVVKDNKITIAFDLHWGSGYGTWLYFFDTLYTSSNNYFTISKDVTCFATLDMDGNRIDVHVIKMYGYMGPNTNIVSALALGVFGARFGIDDEGNTHIFSSGDYTFDDSVHRAYIIVDNDTNRRYLLDIKTMDGVPFTPTMYLKMDSNWNLVTKKYLIDSIGGWKHEIIEAVSYLHFNKVVIGGDEIYVHAIFETSDYSYTPDAYPIKVFLDSVHYLRIGNRAEWNIMPCLIKLNLNGDVVWTQQLYSTYNAPYNYGKNVGAIALDDDKVYNYYWPWKSNEQYYLDSTQTTRIWGGYNTFCLIVSYDRTTGNYVDYYIIDSTTPTRSNNALYVSDDDIFIDVGFYHLYKSELCKINKQTHEVVRVAPITYRNSDLDIRNMSISNSGWVFRGQIGPGPLVYDSIPVGNSQEASVMTFFYDSTLDSRRPKPCPSVDTLWCVGIAGHDVTLSWSDAENHPRYELAYTSDSSDWDGATILETDDTAAIISIPDDKCYYFRVRGLCDGNRRLHSEWSDAIIACPRIGIDNVEQNVSITLYPNPIRQYVNIKLENNLLKEVNGKYAATLSDLTGRSEEVCLTPIGLGVYSLDLSNYPQAVYLLTITTIDGASHTLKLQ